MSRVDVFVKVPQAEFKKAFNDLVEWATAIPLVALTSLSHAPATAAEDVAMAPDEQLYVQLRESMLMFLLEGIYFFAGFGFPIYLAHIRPLGSR